MAHCTSVDLSFTDAALSDVSVDDALAALRSAPALAVMAIRVPRLFHVLWLGSLTTVIRHGAYVFNWTTTSMTPAHCCRRVTFRRAGNGWRCAPPPPT